VRDSGLKRAKAGKGALPKALTAYQVLEMHSRRDELIAKHGRPGRRSGSTFSAAQVVSRALMKLEQGGAVKFKYVATAGMFFIVANEPVVPGYEVCAFYQLTAVGAMTDRVEIVGGVIRLLDENGDLARSPIQDRDREDEAA
jgi:hypothetical protein